MTGSGSSYVALSLSFVILLFVLTGCSSGGKDIGCPFTELSWDASYEDMIGLEGEEYETYDSIYKGLTYTYPKEYLGKPGMIKYMYDADGKLCNVSWAYTGNDAEEVLTVYRAVCDDTVERHGQSTSDDGIGNYCEMWVSEGGTVMANAVITNDTTVMQIAYMSADVSKQGK